MRKIDASIILLTLDAGEEFKKVLSAIFNQTYRKHEVIIIDSSSSDNTLMYAKEYPIRIFTIARSDFGHGKTRNLGAKLARGRYVIYLSQDAIPADNNWLANLLVNLEIRNIAGVFGRQIPNDTANPLDVFNYNEDYPNERRIISSQNYKEHNVIFSDVNSAVKKSILLKHPYPENVLVSEDLGWAIDILKNKYELVYEPTGAVIHSHSFNFKRIFKVSFDQGVSFSQIFQHENSTYLLLNSKNRFIKKMKYLIKNYKFYWVIVSIACDAMKLISVSLGKNYQRLRVLLQKSFSNYPNYWK